MSAYSPARGAEAPVMLESSASAVSWSGIFAGAFVALATTLILLFLGAGIGLTLISPWPNSGASAKTFSITTAIGLIVVQWLSSGMGGYMTGRLRTRWVNVHTSEVLFRDTAHGLLAWALATAVGIVLLTSAASSVIGGGVQAVATATGGAVQAGAQAGLQGADGMSGYNMDVLFRSDRPDPAVNSQDSAAQAGRIIASGLANGEVPAADQAYLAQMISSRTGISPADAKQRVDTVINRAKDAAARAKQVADEARKVALQLSFFTGLSMLIGAFVASVAAGYAGGLRDDHH